MTTGNLQGFKVLPLKFSSASVDSHQIFMKEHSVRGQSEDKPSGRTLFILNVPPYATENALKRVFSVAGEVTAVILSQKPSSSSVAEAHSTTLFSADKLVVEFKVAYIVFRTVASLQSALKLKKLEPLSTESEPVLTGLKKWVVQYNANVPNINEMQKEIDSFMDAFDLEESHRIEHEKSLGEADEEGWVTVTKRGRNPGFPRKESVENKIMKKETAGKKRKELLNFYTFQIRESKMKHLVNLRQRFEEDKKKIALLKQSRKFKPF